MNREPIRIRAERLRALPLTAVLRAWGAQPDPHDRHKWHTPHGVLSVTGPKFMNWSRGVGGGGAIDLVLHLNGGGFRDAKAQFRELCPCKDGYISYALRGEPALLPSIVALVQ